MARCTHKGCGKEYDPASNADGDCAYHPGGPVFHEGLKSWSCCKEKNKPVMEFDQFMAIPGCTTGEHTDEVPKAATPPRSAAVEAPTESKGGVETYGSAPASGAATPAPAHASEPAAPAAAPAPTVATQKPAEPEPVVEEDDDPDVPVPEGARCKRLGCGAAWEGEGVSRGDGAKAVCTYHPQKPIFHEGSKGYLCCKRRVLEFDDFLKIAGCATGKHLFVGAKPSGKEELVDARVDHYQTPTEVSVSVYAKGCNKAASAVRFGPQSIDLDLHLPGNRRVRRTLTLYGPIVPDKCSYRILGTKVDIELTKPQPASWPLLELPPPGSELPPGYALTFGVSGRTGTVGGKDIVLSVEEQAKHGANN